MNYTERIERFKIIRHDAKSKDGSWLLIWSFADEDQARETMVELEVGKPPWYTYRLIDAGRVELRTITGEEKESKAELVSRATTSTAETA